jgi:hypothetical protein
VHEAFADWFKADGQIKENQVERDQALELITTRITDEENRALEAEPDDAEIERVIRDMKKEKAPGIDGVMSEMLLGC